MSTTSAVNSSLIGSAEREFNRIAGTGGQELDKMAFLKLLVAQLQNQDPLNPMEDTEFVSELAQFSSLESLTDISSGVNQVVEGMGRQESISAVNYLGKTVQSYGNEISKLGDDQITELYYNLDQDIISGTINICDSSGSIIRTINLGAQTAGLYPLQWDGLDYTGQSAAKGVYSVYISGITKNNTAALVDTQVAGKVDGVFYEDGVQYLRLEDGRVVELSGVTALVQGIQQTSSAEADSGNNSENSDENGREEMEETAEGSNESAGGESFFEPSVSNKIYENGNTDAVITEGSSMVNGLANDGLNNILSNDTLSNAVNNAINKAADMGASALN